ncbi:MAG: hypothetical protein Q8O74_06520 [bacterium]|nr:hypothetical protein [bacterium]
MKEAGIIKSNPVKLALALLGAGIVFFSQVKLDLLVKENRQGEMMYFPNAAVTKAAAFGYDNLAGDWIWLQTVQYYGQHTLTDRQYKYLGHMFDVLSALAPDFKIAYNFGALLLAHDAADVPAADRLLKKGMENNPEDWAIPFFRGFVHYVFSRNYREAGRWFTVSSRQPQAPEMPARFAAFAMRKGKDLETSRALWAELLNKTGNKTEKALARFYIDKIDRELIIARLQQLAEGHKKQNNREIDSLQDLVLWGHIKKIPSDPLGGGFYWDRKKGKVETKGGRKVN